MARKRATIALFVMDSISDQAVFRSGRHSAATRHGIIESNSKNRARAGEYYACNRSGYVSTAASLAAINQ
jgi:hypothetical protein